MTPLNEGLQDKSHDRKQRQKGGDREGSGEIVLIIEYLHMKRHRISLASNMATHDRYRAEFTHRARIAQNYAVEQAPLDVRKRNAPERLQAARPEGNCRVFLVASLRLHERN